MGKLSDNGLVRSVLGQNGANRAERVKQGGRGRNRVERG